jgi:hypothetical protein
MARFDYRANPCGPLIEVVREGRDGVRDMPQERSFYEGHSFYEGLTWWFIREQIGWGLRKRYQVPKELPPEMLTLVRKLDDSDLLLPSVRWRHDVDLLGG